MAFPNPVRFLFGTQATLQAEDHRRATRGLIADGICSTSMVTLQGGPFLPAFILALGGSRSAVGLLATIVLASQVMQVAGLYLVRRLNRRRGIVVIAASLSRLMWVPIILIPMLFLDQGVRMVTAMVLLSAFIGMVAGPSWNSLIRDLVPPDRMGAVFSTRMLLGTACALVLTLGGGYFVDTWKAAFPEYALHGYSILFGLGLIFGLAGVTAIARLPEPQMEPVERRPLRKELVIPLRDRNFRGLLGYVALWTFAINLAIPFFIVYMLERLDLSLTMVTALTVTSQVTSMAFLRVWGRLADRYSNRSVLEASAPLFLLSVLAWSFTTMPEKHMLTIPMLFGIDRKSVV